MKRSITPSRLFLLLLAIACGATSVQANELQKELLYLKESHPLLRASEFALDAAEQRRKASYSEYFPKVTVTADAGDEKITTNPGLPDSRTTDLSRSRRGITIEQNVFNGGKTRATVSIAELDRQIKDVERKSVSQDITLEALIAYLQVLRNRLLIGLAEANEAITLTQLEMEQKRVQRGSGIAVDEMQASTRLQIVRERRVFYEQGMRDSLAAYQQVFGREPDLTRIQDLDNFISELPTELEQALQRSLEANPRIVVSALQSERAQRSISVERASIFPSVDVVASHGRDKRVGGVFGKDEDSIVVKFTWNFLTGLEPYRRSQAASYDHLELLEREKNTARRTAESTRLSWNQYQKGLERLKFLEQAAVSSKKVMEGRKKLRDAGKETVLAVLDAEVEYFGVLANMVNAMVDARLGSYRLLHALGAIDLRRFDLEGNRFELPVRPVEKVIEQLIGQGYFGPAISPEPVLTTMQSAPEVATADEQRAQAIVDSATRNASSPPEVKGQDSILSESSVDSQPGKALGVTDGPAESTTARSPTPIDQREIIAKTVLSWASAWSNRSFEEYADFYSHSFATKAFQDRQTWLDYRKPRIVHKNRISVEIADKRITTINDQIAEVEFTQFYEGGALKVRSRKKLLLRFEEGNWRISWEGNASDTVIGNESELRSRDKLPSEQSFISSPAILISQNFTDNDLQGVQRTSPVPKSGSMAEPVTIESSIPEVRQSATVVDKEVISQFLSDWARHWSSRDFSAYADLYSESFTNARFSRLEDWLAHRKPRILGKQSINVSVELLGFKVLDTGMVETRLVQRYTGNNLRVRSVKRLILDFSGSTPKILWEGNA